MDSTAIPFIEVYISLHTINRIMQAIHGTIHRAVYTHKSIYYIGLQWYHIPFIDLYVAPMGLSIHNIYLLLLHI